jgi:hypothetical protein
MNKIILNVPEYISNKSMADIREDNCYIISTKYNIGMNYLKENMKFLSSEYKNAYIIIMCDDKYIRGLHICSSDIYYTNEAKDIINWINEFRQVVIK